MKRGFVLYLAAGLFFVYGVDHERVQRKTLNYLRDTPYQLMQWAAKKAGFESWVLKDGWRYYRNMEMLFPERGEVKSTLGFLAFNAGRTDEAAGYYRAALALQPDDFRVLHNLGAIYFNRGDYSRAVRYLDKAVALKPGVMLQNPMTVDPYVPYQADLSGREFAERAMPGIRQAYRNAYEWLAVSYARLSDYPKMLDAALGGMKVDGTRESPFYFYAGVALMKMNQFEEASVMFLRGGEHPELSGESFRYLALCRHALNDDDGGAQALRRAAESPSAGWEARIPARELYYTPPVFIFTYNNQQHYKI